MGSLTLIALVAFAGCGSRQRPRVLVIGLGCENNFLGAFKQVLGDFDPQRIRYYSAQEVEDEFETGMGLLLITLKLNRREDQL